MLHSHWNNIKVFSNTLRNIAMLEIHTVNAEILAIHSTWWLRTKLPNKKLPCTVEVMCSNKLKLQLTIDDMQSCMYARSYTHQWETVSSTHHPANFTIPSIRRFLPRTAQMDWAKNWNANSSALGVHFTYRIAGNFCGCKLLWKCHQRLQKKFSQFLFFATKPCIVRYQLGY